MDERPACPYCRGTAVTRKGARRNKFASVPVFFCKACAKRFTKSLLKHRTYPAPVILSAINRYHRLATAEEAAKATARAFGLPVTARAVRQWATDFGDVLPFRRLRATVAKIQADRATRKMIVEHRLLHGLVYDFKFHRGKAALLFARSANRHLASMQDFLERVPRDCPHDLFRANHRERKRRASKMGKRFLLDEVTITRRDNVAVAMAKTTLQTVTKNTERHSAVQEFMLVNDAATVAVEVPITLTAEDLAHFRERLGFFIPMDMEGGQAATGHIDILQVRNGKIHILDYKPGAEKEKPIEQLMVYALALSRRTRLPLYHFVCAWFDDRHYWEFFPLPVVHKQQRAAQAKSWLSGANFRTSENSRRADTGSLLP